MWGVENLGADSVTIRLVLKTAPHDQLKVTRELRARIKAAFDDAGIEIPFAQRTIWHRSGDGAVAVLPARRRKVGRRYFLSAGSSTETGRSIRSNAVQMVFDHG